MEEVTDFKSLRAEAMIGVSVIVSVLFASGNTKIWRRILIGIGLEQSEIKDLSKRKKYASRVSFLQAWFCVSLSFFLSFFLSLFVCVYL